METLRVLSPPIIALVEPASTLVQAMTPLRICAMASSSMLSGVLRHQRHFQILWTVIRLDEVTMVDHETFWNRSVETTPSHVVR
jgi:hypothetical protein